MKTIVIVGGSLAAALEQLKEMAPNDGIVSRDFYHEVEWDGHLRIMAIGGSPDDVCFLRDAGFGCKIKTVEDEGISEEMWRRICHVRSTEL